MNTLNKIGLIFFLIGCLGLFFSIDYYGIYLQFGLLPAIIYVVAHLMILGGCLISIVGNIN